MCQTPILTQPSGNDPPGLGSAPGVSTTIDTTARNARLEALAKLNQKPIRLQTTKRWFVKPFDDEQTGPSCVGYAVAKLVEALFEEYKPDASRGELDPDFIFAVASKEDSTPNNPRTSIADALTVVRDTGAPLYGEAGSYDPGNLAATPTLLDKAKSHRIRNLVEMSLWIEEWIDWLNTRGPIVVQLNISIDPVTDAQGKTRRRFDVPVPVPSEKRHKVIYNPAKSGQRDSHAVLLTQFVAEGTPHFVFLNSMGPEWGDGGYATIDLEDAVKSFFRGYSAIVRNMIPGLASG
jgi:hypothetical protein